MRRNIRKIWITEEQTHILSLPSTGDDSLETSFSLYRRPSYLFHLVWKIIIIIITIHIHKKAHKYTGCPKKNWDYCSGVILGPQMAKNKKSKKINPT